MYPNPETIIRAVAAVFPVTPEEITGPSRCRNATDARATVVHLAHTKLRMSNHQLCALIGRHTSGTAVFYRRKYDSLYATDKQYRSMVDRVTKLLEVGHA